MPMTTYRLTLAIPEGEYPNDPEKAITQLTRAVQALLYDFGEGSSRGALAGGFTIEPIV